MNDNDQKSMIVLIRILVISTRIIDFKHFFQYNNSIFIIILLLTLAIIVFILLKNIIGTENNYKV